MGKYFGSEPFRVEFPDGQWCEVKSEFSQADLDYITTKMMQAKVSTDGKEKPETDIALVFGKQATLERAITAWSFQDEQGKAIPITPDNISDLRYKYRFILLKEIDRLNQEAGQFLKN